MPATNPSRDRKHAWMPAGFVAICALLMGPVFFTNAQTGIEPAPLNPPNGTKLERLSAQLRWTQAQGVNWYQIQVSPFSNDGPGINLVIGDRALVTSASFLVREPAFGSADANYVVLPDMTYLWRVRTATTQAEPREADWTEWSIPFTFETAVKSSGTISRREPAGSIVDILTPTLTWSNSDPAVFYYEVQLSRDPGFSSAPGSPMLYWELRHGGATLPLNSYNVPAASPLQAGTVYYWRVRPRVQGDGPPVEWTPAFQFQTSASPRPALTPTATTTPSATRTPAPTGTPTRTVVTGTPAGPAVTPRAG